MQPPDDVGLWPPHWRPAGQLTLACGAPHVPYRLGQAEICCRIDPGEVKCPSCLATYSGAQPAPISASGSETSPYPAAAAAGSGEATSAAGSGPTITPAVPGTMAQIRGDLADLIATQRTWYARGWPGPHYDDDDDCPCPDHRALRAGRNMP